MSKIVFSYFFAIIFLYSCKINENLVSEKIKNIPDIKLKSKLFENELIYNKFYSKKASFSVNYNNNVRTFKGNVVIQKDSLILLSIMPLMGIELFRVALTPSQIVILNKNKKEAIYTNYQYLEKRFLLDLDFFSFQALITDNLFLYPNELDVFNGIKKYKHDNDEKSYFFKSIKDKKLTRINKKEQYHSLVYHELEIDPNIFKIIRIFIKDFDANRTVKIQYADYNSLDILFPKKLILNVSEGINKVVVEVEHHSIQINDGGSLHFKVPSAYEKVNL